VNKDIKLSDLVKDKNVLLVGNSRKLLKKDNSDLIDSFEFVIRFNLSIAKLYDYNIGNKCDAWVFAMCRERVINNTYNSAQIKPQVCVRYGAPYKIGAVNINLDVKKDKIRKEIEIDSDMHPSTGIVTTWYMLNKAKPKSISLIGFDSFKNPNFYTSIQNAHLCHNLKAEEAYLRKLSEEKHIQIID
jgi:hypothetical protein